MTEPVPEPAAAVAVVEVTPAGGEEQQLPPPPPPLLPQQQQVRLPVWGSLRSADAYQRLDDEPIGIGQYGEVASAFDKATGLHVALKKVRMDNEKEGFPITACREILLLSRLEHPHVVRLIEVVTSPVTDSVFMVLEYLDHDLAGLADRPGLRFTAPQVKCIMLQILQGLAYCHDRGVLHRDLKASNVLVDNTGCVKLADFGLARRTASLAKQLNWTCRVITLWYRPPELLLGASQYGPEVDCWSAGCIMAELLLSRPLFAGGNEADQLELIYSICGSPTEDNWPGCSRLPFFAAMQPVAPIRRRLREVLGQQTADAIDLLEGLLTLDPARRMSAERAASHPYFFTHPLPCPPHHLPQVEPCHELQMKRRRQQAKAAAQAEEAAEAARRVTEEEERRKANVSGAAPPPQQSLPPPPPKAKPAVVSADTLGMGWRTQEAPVVAPGTGWAGAGGAVPYVVAPSVAIGAWGWHAPPADQRHYAAVAAAEGARRHHMASHAARQRARGAARLLSHRPAAAPARLYPLRELQEVSPSRADGMTPQQEDAFRQMVVRFLDDVSTVLASSPPVGGGASSVATRVPRPVIATAAVFAHRFYARNSCALYENRCHVVGAACLLLACKVDAAPRTLADIVCASYRLRTGGADLLSEGHRPNYPRERDNVLAAESRLVRDLGFHFHVTHALDYLVPAAARLKELSVELSAGRLNGSSHAHSKHADGREEQQEGMIATEEDLSLAPDAYTAAAAEPDAEELPTGLMPQLPPSPVGSPIRSVPGSPVSDDDIIGSGAPHLPSAGHQLPPDDTPAFDAAAVMRAAVSFANDSLRTLLCLQYEAHVIAGGCLALAARLCKCEHVLDGWNQALALGCEPSRLPRIAVADVAAQLVDSYRQLGHTELVDKLAGGGMDANAPHAPSVGTKRPREDDAQEQQP